MENTVILFPGQGTQYVGMGKALSDQFDLARRTFAEADEVLGFSLSELCWEGGLAELTRTVNAQPAILTASLAAFRVFEAETGFKPGFAAGHSLGEISALTAAGAIGFNDALRIARQRGRFMEESSGNGCMTAVQGIERSVAETECCKVSTPEQPVTVSNYNSPDQYVISGDRDAVGRVAAELARYGGRCIPLQVGAAFHCPLMRQAAEEMALELGKYNFQEPNWPVISNVTATPYSGVARITELLVRQITEPVRWSETIAYLQNQGVTIAIDMGPQTILRNLTRKNAPAIVSYAYDNPEERGRIHHLSSRKALPSEFLHTVVTKCIQIAVCTRNRNWNNEEYQKGVIEPYRIIATLQETLERENRKPSMDEMEQALGMLRSVFATKKVPVIEQIERFEEVFEATGTRESFAHFQFPEMEDAS